MTNSPSRFRGFFRFRFSRIPCRGFFIEDNVRDRRKKRLATLIETADLPKRRASCNRGRIVSDTCEVYSAARLGVKNEAAEPIRVS